MPKLVNKLDLEFPKVNERGKLLPVHQSHYTAGRDSFATIPATPTISTSILNSGNTYYFDISTDEVGRIDDICLRLRVACSTADVDCLPPPYWFSRIVIEAEKGKKFV